ncbi:MAG: hypothetical protein CMC33_01015 [Flavobacteriaceae bacterium]|nr:hypothetical protein [Flavobacteriaceae bacterium]
MINNNKFYIENLKNVVFIGYNPDFSKLININNDLQIDSDIITSSDQSIEINHKHIIFDKAGKEFRSYISDNFNIDNTLFISLGARIIFKKDLIKFLKYNLINFHDTRLPYDSGGGGFSWRIMREDRINNQLVHLIDEGIDTGPIIDNKLSIFPSDCKIPIDFENYRQKAFVDFYKGFIQCIKGGENFELKNQVNYVGRYNPRLSTIDNGYINWQYNPYELINFINAFDNPYPGAITFLNRGDFGRLHIKSVQLHGGDSSNHPFMAGIVSRHDKDWIVVSTSGKHSLLIQEVINEKGENILNEISPGDRFFTPNEYLEKAVSDKIIYTALGKK